MVVIPLPVLTCGAIVKTRLIVKNCHEPVNLVGYFNLAAECDSFQMFIQLLCVGDM